MAEIAFRPQASVDLAVIYTQSVEQFGQAPAKRYHDGLQASVLRLAEFPLSASSYPGLRPTIRFVTHRKHHIFYDYDGTTVWIVRILHHAVDVQRWI